jgi:hypothetical protein
LELIHLKGGGHNETEVADIIVEGKIQTIKPTPDEIEDNDGLELALIAFNINRRDYGRLRQMIDVLNGL